MGALWLGGCSRTKPAGESEPPPRSPASGAPPAAFVEAEVTPDPGMLAAGSPPVEGLRYWARPVTTPEEFMEEAAGAGIELMRAVEVFETRELLAAIAPNTMILLHPGRYEITESEGPGHGLDSAYYDGESIHDVHDLALIGVGPGSTALIQADSYASVLSFTNVENLALFNLTIGHRPEYGWCMGDVVRIIDGRNVLIAGTTLFGSGTEGLSLVSVDGLRLHDSVITDCSEQFSTISNSRDVVYEDVDIAGNDSELLRGFGVYHSTLRLRGVHVFDNHELAWEGDWGMFTVDGSYDPGRLYIDPPTILEPGRTVSEIVLENTVIDGETYNRAL
ncbi:hypothetical protein G6O69_17240 [Pseudenhygromyxa sp. WMMC2535]|uniref:hypothetical protein n=1 Tax=Pseudenhygromyxa sp. WMMC2535 TaxID=2712867 RepID=UPI0015540E73|nr:hypothetical protein [Pseudenhygromyxa sp. WMMC2535]NVB39590.1 hypothetical protein [Pseudenhygromyxa sp. WMMC2535]